MVAEEGVAPRRLLVLRLGALGVVLGGLAGCGGRRGSDDGYDRYDDDRRTGARSEGRGRSYAGGTTDKDPEDDPGQGRGRGGGRGRGWAEDNDPSDLPGRPRGRY